MATSTTISGLTALGAAPSSTDLLVLVDVSDPTQAPAGTTKKMTVANLFTSPTFTTAVIVTGTLAVSGNVAINTNKVTIDASTGDTIIAGAINVTGNVSGGSVTSSGNLTIATDGSSKLVLGRYSAGFPSAYTILGTGATAYKWQDTAAVDVMTLTAAGALTVASTVTVSAGGIAATGNSSVTGTLGVSSTLTVGASSASNLVVAGGGAALATNATVGFLMVSSCAGLPTGTPASIPTGTVPMVVDTINARVYFYYTLGWHYTSLT